MAGQGNAANLESDFIAPYVGKLMVYLDEVKIKSATAINEIKNCSRVDHLRLSSKIESIIEFTPGSL
jgi:hypothetical protein